VENTEETQVEWWSDMENMEERLVEMWKNMKNMEEIKIYGKYRRKGSW
jgi:hypothetical protein